MSPAQLAIIGVLVATSILSLLLFQYIIERRQGSKSAFYMALLMLACAVWAGFNAFEYIAGSLAAKLFFADLEYLSIVSIPVLWYAFGSAMDREEHSGKGRDPKLAIWAIPALTALFAWLDPSLGLVRRSLRLEEAAGFTLIASEYGPWFWLHAAYSYSWLAAGTVLIFRGLRAGRGTSRSRLAILVAGTLLPALANLAYISGLVDLRGIDPTPLAFSITCLLLVVNLSRFRFLALVSAAQAGAIEQLSDAVIMLDRGDKLAYANFAAREAFGLAALDLGKGLAELDGPLSGLSPAGSSDLACGDRRFEAHFGEILRRGRRIGSVATLIDVTQRAKELEARSLSLSLELEHRTRSERQLYHDALHDPMTGLANRSLVLSRIELAAARFRRDGALPFGIVYLDFDGFKSINDSHGQDKGDAFLREVALRLKRVTREVDTVARIVGDEFAVLLEDVGGLEDIEATASRVAEELSVPFALGRVSIVPSASIGILLGGADHAAPEEYLRDANLARQSAKAAGKNGRAVFNEEMRRRFATQNLLLDELRSAISSGGIDLAFQPIVLMDGSPAGCEVLARWNHRELGAIGPARFIPLAESSGLILPLGTLVLIETLKRASALLASGLFDWREKAGEPPFFFAVNVSAIQLGQPDFAELVLSSMDRAGLPHAMLHLEITESAIMENRDQATAVVEALAAEGISFKLDDFGTGYSSLGYLHRIPIDSVKIDRSFIERIGHPDAGGLSSYGIVRGIISLAHELGKTVVAEGIETEEQSRLLRGFGCDFAQGYFFGRPMAAAAHEEYLRTRWNGKLL